MQKENLDQRVKWEGILGKEFLQDLILHFPEVKDYFEKNDFHNPLMREDFIYEKVEKEKKEMQEGFVLFLERIFEEVENEWKFFFRPFLLLGCIYLQKRIRVFKGYTFNIYIGFMESLLNELAEICIRVIISEIEKSKNQKTLLSEHEWDIFWQKMFQKYPILDYLIECSMKRKIEMYEEVVVRFQKDKMEIATHIFDGRKLGNIDRIDAGFSDSHFSGKQILKIKTEKNMFLIYKPHSLENEKWFYEFAQFIGEKCNIQLYNPRLLSYEKYGWSETIIFQPCMNETEVKKYYERMGIYIFVAYLLGTHDIHYENLITMGEYPVIVDLECISLCKTREQMNESNSIYEKLRNSVVSSGILPYSYWNNGKESVDLSALCGGNNEKAPFKIPMLKITERGKKSIIYERPNMTSGFNRVLLRETTVSPADYEKEILAGFEKAYKQTIFFLKEVEEKIYSLNNLRSRYLLAHTQKYNMILQTSYHPQVISETYGRHLILQLLWKNKNFDDKFEQKIVEAEIRDLLNHSIPYFYFYMDKADLYDSYGNKLADYFVESSLIMICQRLHNLDLKDLSMQKRLIHITLNGNNKENLETIKNFRELREMIRTPNLFTKVEILKMAEEIGKKVFEEAIYNQDKAELDWLNYEIVKKDKSIVHFYPCNMYLYNGLSGALIFFFFLSRCSKRSEFLYTYKTLEKQLCNYTNAVAKRKRNIDTTNSGLYNGEAAIVYTYLILFWETKREKYLKYAIKHSKILDEVANKDPKFDLLEGRAGAVFVLCCLFQTTSEFIFIEKAQNITEDIIKGKVKVGDGIGWKQGEIDNPLLGMAHGNSGIMLSLMKLYQANSDKKYYECFQKAFSYECENYDPYLEDWNDYRQENCQKTFPARWCHGCGGILLAYMLICKMKIEEPERRKCMEEIFRAFSCMDNRKSRMELCLCHGECGNNIILREFIETIGRDVAIIKPYNICENKILTKEWYNYGLMDGIVGIGYYLLLQYEVERDYILLLKD